MLELIEGKLNAWSLSLTERCLFCALEDICVSLLILLRCCGCKTCKKCWHFYRQNSGDLIHLYRVMSLSVLSVLRGVVTQRKEWLTWVLWLWFLLGIMFKSLESQVDSRDVNLLKSSFYFRQQYRLTVRSFWVSVPVTLSCWRQVLLS